MRVQPTCLALICLTLLACQGRGVTPGARVPMSVRPASAKPALGGGRPAAPTLQAAPPTPTPPPMVPAMARPPTPVPSGYLATLPPGVVLPTFAPWPEASLGGGQATPPATPVASPSPARIPSRVLSSNLAPGVGELSGAVFEPADQAPRPVPEVRVLVTDALEPTRKAELRSASDGTFRLSGITLGGYYVRVEKEGYEADTAPTLLQLYPGYPAGHTLFLIVPQP
ncbi:MAG: carboxypeptidase regulatory-like domain-containing protein [Candidatus Sericytochromatia bacterium]|nr:carboxypeptidase regulatory-like domain-containing protein [Candidatus Sericytochromatia bacterium]